VVGGNGLPTDQGYYTVADMRLLRERVEEAGLRLTVISGLPEELTYKIKLGLPGRDEQIDNWRKTLRNMGEAGIDTLVYFFSLRSWYGNYGLRTDRAMPGRGGSKLTGFDYDDVKDETRKYWSAPVPESVEADDEQIWDNITYFLKAVVPVAEEAEVRMGLHPDDPPISPIGGVARVFRSHTALRHLIEIVPSDSNGLTFCAGTISEMPEDVLDAIRYFGSRDKIFHVHFRSVTGTVPSFSETFIGEGHVNMMEAMVDNHVPDLVEGSERQYRSHAYAMGYIKALIDAVKPG